MQTRIPGVWLDWQERPPGLLAPIQISCLSSQTTPRLNTESPPVDSVGELLVRLKLLTPFVRDGP